MQFLRRAEGTRVYIKLRGYYFTLQVVLGVVLSKSTGALGICLAGLSFFFLSFVCVSHFYNVYSRIVLMSQFLPAKHNYVFRMQWLKCRADRSASELISCKKPK